mmetsp:Transcript_20618/g.41260  ORF Transcript_20618/g.41260 Transcript_20618/m.41260 type:complete len:407 (-) Transcript_20618:86-1306(-)
MAKSLMNAVICLILFCAIYRIEYRWVSDCLNTESSPNYLNNKFNDLPYFSEVSETVRVQNEKNDSLKIGKDRCAINLWGLPRAFKSLVLPSLIKNVIRPNADYGCDYFVHYYEVTEETAGRSGAGGSINFEDIKLLERAVHDVARDRNLKLPHVGFKSDRMETFEDKYSGLLKRIRTEKNSKGEYRIFPYKAATFTMEVIDNILKMWHTIQESWSAMQSHAELQRFSYERVAMLRNDVVYVTPIDVYEIRPGEKDTSNEIAVIPGFGRYPINDRMIYGPARAVEIWASHRFKLLDRHIDLVEKTDPGFGLHSEIFMAFTIFPRIRSSGFGIAEHDKICFFRARSDETVWFHDCDKESKESIVDNLPDSNEGTRKLVSSVIGHKCRSKFIAVRHDVLTLNCRRKKKL